MISSLGRSECRVKKIINPCVNGSNQTRNPAAKPNERQGSILAVRGKCQGRVAFSLACAHCEIEEIQLPGSFEKVEASEGDGQREAAGAGAAGVDIEDAVAPVGFGFVGVSADDDVVAGGRRIEV